jgi:hypothetical protein
LNKTELTEYSQAISTDCGKGFVVGNEVYFAPLHVNGRFFHFKPDQTKFLYLLTKTNGDIEKACTGVAWPREKAEKFFATRKWREYREQLLATAAVRNGDLREFWWEFMFDGARGYTERYVGTCELCKQDYALKPEVIEQYRGDDMVIDFACRICKQPVKLDYQQMPFRPSREQVQCAVEVGNRVEPKTERVAHTFSNETIVFATGEESAA